MCASINKTNSFQEFHYVFLIYTVLYKKQVGSQPSRKLNTACVEIISMTDTNIYDDYPNILF